jgi:hypothetical protein
MGACAVEIGRRGRDDVKEA